MFQSVDGGGVCPTCGAGLALERLVIDLDTNTVSYAGHRWHVCPKLAEFMFTLNRDWPKAVRDFVMRQALWGDKAEDLDKTNLAIYACRARQMLLPFGIRVERLHGRAFRLVMPTH